MAVSGINIEQLLKPISKENPIGEALTIYELRTMAEGTPKTPWAPAVYPNWKNVYRTSQKLLHQGKDLWAIHYLIISATELYEFQGLIKGLQLLKQMLEKYWDNIPPLLEPDAEEEFCIARLSPISTLCSRREHLYQKLVSMPLIKTRRVGAFSFKELKSLADEYGIRKEEHENIELNHIYAEIRGEQLDTLIADLNKCFELFTAINNFIDEKVGADFNRTRANEIISLFGEMLTFFKESLSFTAEPTMSEQSSKKNANSNATPNDIDKIPQKGQLVSNREDVVKIINELCRWIEENEPSTPSLLLLENARNLIGKKFVDISNELKNLFEKLNKTVRILEELPASFNNPSDTQSEITEGNNLQTTSKAENKTNLRMIAGKQKIITSKSNLNYD